jgi:type I restriction enzyme S subunit
MTKTALPSVVGTDVGGSYFVTPNIEEQSQIVKYLDKKCDEIDNLISQKEQLLTELESYKKSLIFECVTGKREVV